jgi:hypothetical protein
MWIQSSNKIPGKADLSRVMHSMLTRQRTVGGDLPYNFLEANMSTREGQTRSTYYGRMGSY